MAGDAGEGAGRQHAPAGVHAEAEVRTEAEITLLRSLAEADVVTVMPEDDTAAAVVRFEAPGQPQGFADGRLGGARG